MRTWLLIPLVALCSLPARADRAFPWTWTSATLTKGSTDAQLWLSMRAGRRTPFDLLEVRGWVSAGVLSRVDVHFGLEADFLLLRREQKDLDGRLSALVRYRFLDPDVLGIALLARGGVGVASAVLEGRLVLDRTFGDVLIAANSSYERTVFWDRRDAVDTRLEQDLAIRLQVSPEVSAGFEARARTALKSGQYQGTAFYVGPTLSVSTKFVWLSVGAVAQIASDKAEGDRGDGLPVIYRDDERFHLRLVVAAPTAK